MPVPFGVGERLEYDVRFGRLKVGSGTMEVAGLQEVRGRETWHTVFSVRGGNFMYRVNDRYESWIDTHTGNSLRFKQDQHEGTRDVERTFEFYPDRAVFTENGEADEPSVNNPLDDGSFIYFLRTIPLNVGETYSFERYFRPDRNPVTIRVLRRERIRVPAPTADRVNIAHATGHRVVAVGTTVVRAQETAAAKDGRVAPYDGWTDLVITPERGVRVVDGLLTGWHEPEASHLLMLEAVADRDLLRRSYEASLAERYRWHEFGDVHLILP